MTVRTRIILACLVFIFLCGAMATSAWRTQQRLSTLAIDLYDHAFVAQDFLGRATVAFERKGPLATIRGDLDIAAGGVLAPKTLAVLATIRASLAALPALPPADTGAA